MGNLYYSGHGVTQDYAQARTFYQKACDAGYMPGCTSLGYLYDSGKGSTQDYSQARRLYQQACDGGTGTGCTSLGNTIWATVCFKTTLKRAYFISRPATTEMLSDVPAWVMSFIAARESRGTMPRLVLLIKKHCFGGIMSACAYLGNLYYGGLGVAQDYTHARALYQQACEGGYNSGCSSLGMLYSNGQGATRTMA